MTGDLQAIIETVASVFRAVKVEDFEAFTALIREDFFIHENGQRFDGRGIFDLIANLQRDGAVFEWDVTDALIHVNLNLATVAYVNRGAVTRSGIRTPVVWLETAVLSREQDIWRVAYMTSMRNTESATA